jgi:hypothetical protein
MNERSVDHTAHQESALAAAATKHLIALLPSVRKV